MSASNTVFGKPLEVIVDYTKPDDDESGFKRMRSPMGAIERAIKKFKRDLAAEGTLKELKKRRYYEKPSVKRKRKEREAIKRKRKLEARAGRYSRAA